MMSAAHMSVPAADLNAHYGRVLRGLAENRVVPLLGAGVNLCERHAGEEWKLGITLPNGSELATYLARAFFYPEESRADLLRVAQYAAVTDGTGPLYNELRSVFRRDYSPTRVHRFFAALPKTLEPLRAEAPPDTAYPLIVTTNYDDALERAFEEAGEQFDVVWYIADGEQRGKFWHRPPGGEPRTIERPNEYDELSLEQRTVILKIHGAVDRKDAHRDSYVITEDHYIDYLTKTELQQLVPSELCAKLVASHFLFLGYSMGDWNLRVILHRIWGRQPLSYKSWAIQRDASDIERKLWNSRDVEVLDRPLDEYIDDLQQRLNGNR
jgi:hypothetical protein